MRMKSRLLKGLDPFLVLLVLTILRFTNYFETFLPNWLSLLIVTLFLGALAALLAYLGINRIKKGTPPVPEQALAEAKLTTEALKGNGRH